jgi:hypothetical protein
MGEIGPGVRAGEPVTILLVLILLPAVPLAFVRPAGRLAFFAIGLVFFLAISLTPMGRSGLHGEGMVLALPGLGLCVAVLLGEILARAARYVQRRRRREQ